MKFLLAPDKFKDALSAAAVCGALADGVRRVHRKASIVHCPLADGGEGTGQLLAQALQAQEQPAVALDPLGRERAARWWYLPARRLAIVEMAEASGLWRLRPSERSALRATSFGTGQLLRAAFDAGARHILLAVGGSATVDGGAGCLQALGWRLFDAGGREIRVPGCGATLAHVAALRAPPPGPSADIEILCDVDNPLLGDRGAAPVFAPQKGASASEVATLVASLAIWTEVLEKYTGGTAFDQAGTGAAGGLPAALAAAYGAKLVSGFERVAELVGLDDKLAGCLLCLTGEGRLDEQTGGGKVVAGVARHACAARVPVVALVGAACPRAGSDLNALAAVIGLQALVPITPPGTPLEQALADTAANLRRATAEYLRTMRGQQ